MIAWPVVIKHYEDSELSYIANPSDWAEHIELNGSCYDETDTLVDSSGATYLIVPDVNGEVIPQPTGDKIVLSELLGWIKAHASEQGSCCVAKLYARSVAEAIGMIATLTEQ